MARALLCATLACTCLAGASAQWMKSFMDSMVGGSEKATTIQQLVAETGGISTETCGGPEDALMVEHISVEANALAVTVRGTLARQLNGGTVRAKMNIDKPPNLSITQHLKHVAATAFTRARVFSEPLCEHLGVHGASGKKGGEGCAIPAGSQEMRFSFKQLPEMVFVGKYSLEIRAADEEGRPVACVRGTVNVQPGKDKGMLRKLENDGCPGMMLDNWWAFHSFWVEDRCGPENRFDLNFDRNSDADFWLQGHWHEYCEDHDEDEKRRLDLYHRKNGLFEMCEESMGCGHLGCSGVECRWCDGCGHFRCEPAEVGDDEDEDNRCEKHEAYYIEPHDIENNCYDGAPHLVSAAVPRRWLAAAYPAVFSVLSALFLLQA